VGVEGCGGCWVAGVAHGWTSRAVGGGHGRATGARDVGGAVRGGWGQSDCVE
jgi:hypothetical protein